MKTKYKKRMYGLATLLIIFMVSTTALAKSITENSMSIEDRVKSVAVPIGEVIVCPPTLLVTNTDNAGCGSLRMVVNDASPGDTIRFDSSLNGDTIFLTTGQISIMKSLVIIGNGRDSTIISGSDTNRIFFMDTTTTVFLCSMTLRNGNSSYEIVQDGGAIFFNGNLNLKDILIEDNYADDEGGGIYGSDTSGTLVIRNTTISENRADDENGGGVNFLGDTLVISNAEVEDNYAEEDGGGMYADAHYIWLDSLNVKNNYVEDDGGGVYLTASYIGMYNSSIGENYSEDRAGGGDLNADTIFLNNLEVYENDADDFSAGGLEIDALYADIRNSRIIDNRAERDGGGMEIDANHLVMDSMLFADNYADEHGGGLYVEGQHIEITNSRFTTNEADSDGGGIYADSEKIELNNIVIDSNESNNGGGVMAVCDTAFILKSMISANEATRNYGGGVVAEGNVLVMDSCLVENNKIGDDGGGMYVEVDSVIIRKTSIRNNLGEEKAGGVYFYGGNHVLMENVVVDSNTTDGEGGGILVEEVAKMYLISSTVSNNCNAIFGGGIYSINSGLRVINSTISGNSASFAGGGLFSDSSSTVISSTITLNSAPVAPGIGSNREKVFLQNTILAGNITDSIGGDGGFNPTDTTAGFISMRHNLIGDTTGMSIVAEPGDIFGDSINPVNAQLGPLANNGGCTKTHALLCGSPAIDNANGVVKKDQRGIPRAFGAGHDIGSVERQSPGAITTTAFTDSICSGDSLFVGGGWQDAAGVYTDTAISAAGCDSLLVTTLHIKPAGDCDGDSTETILYLVSDSAWTLSTEVTMATSNSYPWPGVAAYLPHDSTFTLPVEVGQPYSWTHLYPVMGSEVITARSGVTYYRYEFELTEHQALNARFRMFVDDNMQIFVNRHEVALEEDMGKMNWRTANHDILFNDNGIVENGYLGGDPFDTFTSADLDTVFKTGANDIILAIRNRTSKPDLGGFSFRLDLDKAGKGVIVKKDFDSESYRDDVKGFVLYPNPTQAMCTLALSFENLVGAAVNVYDFSGTLMDKLSLTGQEMEINLGDYPSGVYLIRVSYGHKTYTQKLIKR